MARTYVGCSGWSYKEWRGLFYPEKLPQKEYFPYYTRFFNTVEVNSTFYSTPLEKTVRSWYTQAPQGFKFSLKVNRSFTHLKTPERRQENLSYFYGLGDILAEKMGCFLFQFPARVVYTPRILDQILGELKKEYKNVVEFRHASWWTPYVFRAFEKENITFCTVNGFPVPERFIVTNARAYIRFHGDPTYAASYSQEDLLTWARKTQEKSAEETWTYFNNTYKGHATQNALFLNLAPDKI